MALTNNNDIGSNNELSIEERGNLPPHMLPLPDDEPIRTSSKKLGDQAATAALYGTHQNNQKPKPGHEFLDSDNKLSSAGAAASLKYANPRDLPSYPSSGLSTNQSAAGTAASLGWQNQKSFEHWKPDLSAAASAAALSAKDYKMKPLWQPESSAHGAKAALLAHKANKGVELWRPEPTAWGNTAATQAMKKGNTLSPQLDYGHTALGRQGSLLAATGAMASSRKRANSTPMKAPKPETYPDEANASRNALRAAISVHKTQNGVRQGFNPDSGLKATTSVRRSQAGNGESYPDQANATTNALRAATSAHKSQNEVEQKPYSEEIIQTNASNALRAAVSVHKSKTVRKPTTFEKGHGSVPFTTLAPAMYTSNPPVEQFDQQLNKDQSREDVLKASAIAMAKKMYNQQQKQPSQARSGATAAHGQRRLSLDSDDEPTPMQFNNLQERAQQLANERLSKLNTEDMQNREYRNYYGSGGAPSSTSRLSLRGRTRRRASSFDEDRHQSEKIRAQMNLFSNNVSHVDDEKRQRDREALVAAAQRNVNKSLHGMDEQVFADTGKVAPSLLNEWELKAHQAAQAKSEARLENFGKVNIGGGKFVDQSVIDDAAARKIQPVLDEMNTKAEAQRFRDAELRLEEENRRRKSQEAKMREKESKAVTKKLKQQEKDEEKERKADEKVAKKERRKSTRSTKSTKSEPEVPVYENATTITTGEIERPTTAPVQTATRTSVEEEGSLRMDGSAIDTNASQRTTSNTTSPTSDGSSKVKNWIKSKVGKFRHSKTSSESSVGKKAVGNEKGFVGGHSFTGASVNNSTTSFSRHSVQDIANAGLVPGTSPTVAATQEPEEFERAGPSNRHADEVSSLSEYSGDKGKGKEVLSGDDSDEDEFQEARDNFEDLKIPRPFSSRGAASSVSPARVPRFHEEI